MKKIVSLTYSILILLLLLSVSVSASPKRLIDDADLLTYSEETKLTYLLDTISQAQDCDIVILTVEGLQGHTPQDFADDFYDYSGYKEDGILLLISMEERDWYISTTGFGITAITDAGLNYISDKFLDDLSDGNYYSAFKTYADLCDKFITKAKTGKPYDINNMPFEPLDLIWIPISLVVGFIISLVITGGMKSELKSVRFKAAAEDYVKKGTLKITNAKEMFLYNQVNRVARETESRSSGGSSTHTSSSGTSHGGGGGKF